MKQEQLVQIARRGEIAETDFYPLINAMYERIWEQLLPPQLPTAGLTTRRANNVVTPADAPVPDCVTCGACCMALVCVGVRPDEPVAAEDYWDVTVEDGNGALAVVDRFVRRDAETSYCASLEIRNGVEALCRIYENRPQICRDFEAGSDKCRALRRAFGYEPFLSLEEMPEAMRKLEARPAASAPHETIREVKFVPIEAGRLEVAAHLKDGSIVAIHSFDPRRETWRQFEFDGLTLREAAGLIASRR
jgi:uncharacterized protein